MGKYSITRNYNFVKVKPADYSILDRSGVLYQPKHDGISAEIFVEDKNDISIIGKGITKGKDSDFTRKFPELVAEIKRLDLPEQTDFLSEVIVINKKTGIEECGLATGRSGREEDIPAYAKMFPALGIIHDVVSVDGQNVSKIPYLNRLGALRGHIRGSNILSIIKNTANGKEEWQRVESLKLEGIVIRDPNAILGQGVWKLKREITEDVYCKGEFEISKSETYSNMQYKVDGKIKKGVFANLKCYQLTESGREINVCDVGGGFSYKDRIDIQSAIDRGIVTAKNPLVLEVKANSRYENGKLRGPNFLRVRFDKKWKECIIYNSEVIPEKGIEDYWS